MTLAYSLGDEPGAHNLANISDWANAHVGAEWVGKQRGGWIEIRLGKRRTILTRSQAYEIADRIADLLATDKRKGNIQ